MWGQAGRLWGTGVGGLGARGGLPAARILGGGLPAAARGAWLLGLPLPAGAAVRFAGLKLALFCRVSPHSFQVPQTGSGVLCRAATSSCLETSSRL